MKVCVLLRNNSLTWPSSSYKLDQSTKIFYKLCSLFELFFWFGRSVTDGWVHRSEMMYAHSFLEDRTPLLHRNLLLLWTHSSAAACRPLSHNNRLDLTLPTTAYSASKISLTVSLPTWSDLDIKQLQHTKRAVFPVLSYLVPAFRWRCSPRSTYNTFISKMSFLLSILSFCVFYAFSNGFRNHNEVFNRYKSFQYCCEYFSHH